MRTETRAATDEDRDAAHLEDLARWLHSYYSWSSGPSWEQIGDLARQGWRAQAEEEHLMLHPRCLADDIHHAEESPDAP